MSTGFTGNDFDGIHEIADSSGTDPSIRIRLGVKALLVDQGRVLFVRESHADGIQFWTLPGGGVKPGESPIEALRRELAEELNATISVGSPLGFVPYHHRTTPELASVYVVFGGRLREQTTPYPGDCIEECAWVEPESFPDNLLAAFEARIPVFLDNFTPSGGSDVILAE